MRDHYRSKTGEDDGTSTLIIHIRDNVMLIELNLHLPSLCPSPEKATNFGFGFE